MLPCKWDYILLIVLIISLSTCTATLGSVRLIMTGGSF